MTISPDNIPNLTAPSVGGPDALTLLSLIREDLSKAAGAELTRDDEKALVTVSSVSNGVFLSAVALSKSGEYRFLDFEINTIREIWALRKAQYEAKKNDKSQNEKYMNNGSEAKPEGDAWYSITFTIENDGFVSKTAYNYDKPVFTSDNPEEFVKTGVTPVGEQLSVWSREQYLEDLEQFPRASGIPEWLN